jgi:hypothetical protein
LFRGLLSGPYRTAQMAAAYTTSQSSGQLDPARGL